MAYKDLRHFINTLEQKNMLKRIKEPVSCELEITEITDRVVKSGGPALLFENVEGYQIPVAINLFGSHQRMAVALELDDINKISSLIEEPIKLITQPPKGGFLEQLSMLPKLAEIANITPKIVSTGSCKEIIVKGENVDIMKFPVLKCWPEDAGRFITFGLVFTKDPGTGKRNCGVYRMQVFDKNTTGMHFHLHKDGARHLRKAKEMKRKLEVAVAIGSDPAVCFAATCPLPPDADEMLLAGFLRKKPVEMVKCEIVDLEVPANSEIVLEGYIDPDEVRLEGPFGDHTGFYSVEDAYPVFHVQAITHRKDPIYHTIVVGKPPGEDYYMGYAIERMFLPIVKMILPEVVDYHMPPEGVFHNLLIVSIKKEYPGHARKVMHALWGLGAMMFTKVMIVVDEDVDVHNLSEVLFKALGNFDPGRDVESVYGPLDILEHASAEFAYGVKIGIDATRKFPQEGHRRKWPKEIKMSPEIKALVDKKWHKYGLDI